MNILQRAPGHNHLRGETLEMVREDRILEDYGCRKGGRYKVASKAGMLITLFVEGKETEWISDPHALESLRPVFCTASKFILQGCALYAKREKVRLVGLEGGRERSTIIFRPQLTLVQAGSTA